MQSPMQSHASFGSPLLRSLVIGLVAFLTVIDLFAAQAILPSLARAYNVAPAAMGLAVNASTLLFNYNAGPFTVGAGDAFLQIPQTITTPPTASEGFCGASTTATSSQTTCKFQQFRVALGYGGLTKRGFSAATNLGFDAELKQLQFTTAQTTYNWDCCGVTLEYRRYAIANVRNENLFRFTFSLANIGSFGNLRKQERLY